MKRFSIDFEMEIINKPPAKKLIGEIISRLRKVFLNIVETRDGSLTIQRCAVFEIFNGKHAFKCDADGNERRLNVNL